MKCTGDCACEKKSKPHQLATLVYTYRLLEWHLDFPQIHFAKCECGKHVTVTMSVCVCQCEVVLVLTLNVIVVKY